MSDVKTPMLDELSGGQWPSFVDQIKQEAVHTPRYNNDMLKQLEISYSDNRGHWKHGGLVGVTGYGAGIIGRYTDIPNEVPGVAQFHTVRVIPPTGLYYTTEALRFLMGIWNKYGSGLMNLHGTTGDIIFLGTRTNHLELMWDELAAAGWDLGGSGSSNRTPSACLGKSRCDAACIDTMDLIHNITNHVMDELHRPAFPYKFKIKASGCPNDCVAANARSDLAIIGIWKDDIRINAAELKNYFAKHKDPKQGFDMVNHVALMCPSRCIEVDVNAETLNIRNGECVKCMHCINVMPKALHVGEDTGAVILMGAKAPIVEGALMGTVLVPFMKMDKDDDYQDFKDLLEKTWDYWEENGQNRERIGETIQRVGLAYFLQQLELEPNPNQINAPRDNPYIFYDEFFDEEEEAAG
ncbi:MAG: dissimilatory-type sulfite reductase subunit alpha [Magnetococcales bacterium]|nr:dissimilatory-type sulfite reductase subunit alpha [Magnetococcales bacterium]